MAILLPLVCKSLKVVLIVLFSMRVAIGPLMARAGVVGIAVWPGAQLIIADVLSGVFFLLEKALSSHQASK